jgi:isopentenyl phosphate kinase
MYIIKLGGSVITDKSKNQHFKKDIAKNLSNQIKKSNEKVIIVHGAGSFGHILAKKYDLNSGYKNEVQIKGFASTQSSVQKLNSLILESLIESNIPAISIPPHVILKLKNHEILDVNLSIFKEYLDRGFMPVTFGDVALDKKLGFSICSGDLLIEILANHFKPEKVIFVLDEDGLYSSNPKIDKNAKFIKKASLKELDNLATSLDSHADVTKGMFGKIETIKKISTFGIDTILLNGSKDNRLYETLVGKSTISTLIPGEKQ